MQIVSNGDNLFEPSNPVAGKNKKTIINLSSAEYAQRVVKVKQMRPYKVLPNKLDITKLLARYCPTCLPACLLEVRSDQRIHCPYTESLDCLMYQQIILRLLMRRIIS